MNQARSFAPPPLDPWDGILLVDKPSGFTSHDVVAKIRHHFRLKKVGHGGTLDPLATGLLVILTGRGTRLSDQIMGSDKTYQGVMRLGIATDSQDADGQVIAEADASQITEAQLREQMAKRVGDQMQTPPMVSAVKKNGVPLYKLARKGEVVEREARLIHVYQYSLDSMQGLEVTFTLRCTKGTYVRTLCADIGEELGCYAHLKNLRRTQSGNLSISQASTMPELLALSPEEFYRKIIPIRELPSILA